MERFIRHRNIERYRRLLALTVDEAERRLIASLLAAEEAREAGDPARPVPLLRRIPELLSVGLPGYQGRMAEPTEEPRCPRCGASMQLKRVVPRVAVHPELRTFECRVCREVTTEQVAAE